MTIPCEMSGAWSGICLTREEPLLMLDLHTPGSRPDRDVYFVGDAPEGFTVK